MFSSRKTKAVAAILLAVTGAAVPAGAVELAEPSTRQGYFLAVRPQLVSAWVDDSAVSGALVGPEISIAIGQMLTDQVGLGFELQGGAGFGSDWSSAGGGLGVLGVFYPFEALPFGVRASTGFNVTSLLRNDGDLERSDDPSGILGARLAAGLFYELDLTRASRGSGGLGLRLGVDGHVLLGDDIVLGGVAGGIAMVWYFGLPKSRLQLPDEEAYTP